MPFDADSPSAPDLRLTIRRLWRDDSGCYVTDDGCHHSDPEDVLDHLLGFCGCGSPEAARAYARDGLALIESEHAPREAHETREAWTARWERIKAARAALFGTDGAAYFFWYWADARGLTEHGGSVPGWLTTKGKEILHDLRILLADAEATDA